MSKRSGQTSLRDLMISQMQSTYIGKESSRLNVNRFNLYESKIVGNSFTLGDESVSGDLRQLGIVFGHDLSTEQSGNRKGGGQGPNGAIRVHD